MERTVHATLAHRILTGVAGPAIGALIGALAGLLYEYAVSISWLGFAGAFGYGEYVGEPVFLAFAALAGTVGGAAFAAAMISEALRMRVSETQLSLAWDDARVHIPAAMVRSVAICKDIVVLGEHGTELSRVRNDLDRRELLAALQEYGYTAVIDADPYDLEFTAFDEDDDSLDDDVRKLLTARAHAVRTGAHGDAEMLRRRLVARGVMVRDIHRRGMRPVGQQWRVPKSVEDPAYA